MMNNEQHKTPVSAPVDSFQGRVQPWMMTCFGAEISADGAERNHRFLEESLELVQACGCTASEAHQLVDYVYGRPVGERAQEVGGVMVTLAALCLAQGLNMHAAGETELARIWTKVEAIRAKQAAKPKHSPLPAAVPQVVADERAAFEVWAKAEGLIQESHGIRSTNSMCDVALKAWKAGRSALAAVPVQVQEPVACKTCGGAGIVSDGEINAYPDGTPYMNGPVKCVKDCPDCAKPVAPVQPVAVPDGWTCTRMHDMGTIKDTKGEFIAQCYYQVMKTLTDRHNASIAAPAAQGDAKDTERLRWLAETGARISWSMDGEYCAVWLPDERDGTESRPAEGYPLKCYDSWHRAIDAAIAAKAAS